MAKVEKLKPLEIELRRLEDLSQDIVHDFTYMKEREEQMRDTNGKQIKLNQLTYANYKCLTKFFYFVALRIDQLEGPLF